MRTLDILLLILLTSYDNEVAADDDDIYEKANCTKDEMYSKLRSMDFLSGEFRDYSPDNNTDDEVNII